MTDTVISIRWSAKSKFRITKGGDMKLRTTLVFAGLTFFVVTGAVGLGAQKASGAPSKEDQESAVGSLRSINTAEVYYAKEYGKGYSSTLAALGVPPEGTKPSATAANLLDNSLTGGVRRNYVFTYKPGGRDADGKINTYAVSARPTKWQKGVWSFFNDETGIIRGTDENRAAKASDPLLQ
jgi:hypothetical protein